MRARPLAACLAACFAALLAALTPRPASAQEGAGQGAASTTDAQTEPAAPAEAEPAGPSASPYVRQVRAGLAKLMAGDVAGAAVDFREANGDAPDQPAAHCHLATALRKQGDQEGALEQAATCARLAAQAEDPLHEARGRLAEVRLRLEGDDGDATRQALAALLRFAERHGALLPLEEVRQLQQAFEQIVELDAVSADVRARREERAAARAEAEAESGE